VYVAVGADGAEFEHGIGARDAPAGSGDVQVVFDQVAAGTFDDAGGDQPIDSIVRGAHRACGPPSA
jgi:hypothetical protein